MTNPFWNSTAHAVGGPLTAEAMRAALDAVAKQPARRCPHIHSSSHRRKLVAAGRTTTTCMWCGAQVRV